MDTDAAFLSPRSAEAETAAASPRDPELHEPSSGRLCYVETRPFANYAATLHALVVALREQGWLRVPSESLPYQAGQKDARRVWDFVAKHNTSPRLEVRAADFLTFDGAEGASLADRRNAVVEHLHAASCRAVLVMGTLAGEELAKAEQRLPILVFSTSNAVAAGIVASDDDSGRDNLWAHLDPRRYRTQVEVFHELVKFRTLGVVFEDSAAGRSFAAVSDVMQVARERGFEVRVRHVRDGQRDRARYLAEALQAHRELSAEVDGMYLTLYLDRTPDMLPQLLSPFAERRIPVLGQQGAVDVRGGALLSVYRADFLGVGRFGAEVVVGVLRGEAPRKFRQYFENPPSLAFNLGVAKRIGFSPPFDLLVAADEIVVAFPEALRER